MFVKSKLFDYVIITLVLFYTGIIFVYFALDTKDYEGVTDIVLALNVIQFFELAILIIFCIEILLRAYIVNTNVKQYKLTSFKRVLFTYHRPILKTHSIW